MSKVLQYPSPSAIIDEDFKKQANTLHLSDVSEALTVVYEGLFPCVMNNDVEGLMYLVKELGVPIKKMQFRGTLNPLTEAVAKKKLEMVGNRLVYYVLTWL